MQSIMKKFKVYARRVENPQNPDSYNVDHTSLVFLMNERSEFVDILNPGLPEHESAAAILNKIKNKTQWKMWINHLFNHLFTNLPLYFSTAPSFEIVTMKRKIIL